MSNGKYSKHSGFRWSTHDDAVPTYPKLDAGVRPWTSLANIVRRRHIQA